VRGKALLYLLSMTMLACGCATAADPMRSWVRHEGGVLCDARGERAQRALARLIGKPLDSRLTVQVLQTPVVCAYGWPTGHLFVTQGLIDRLDDDELAAALAHEMGHLLDHGRLPMLASLRGCCNQSADAEVRADALGAGLLASHGIPTGAMISMLAKVRSCNDTHPGCREAIGHRIELLQDAPADAINAPPTARR